MYKYKIKLYNKINLVLDFDITLFEIYHIYIFYAIFLIINQKN